QEKIARRRPLHALADLLPHVIEILKHDANREKLLLALGAPPSNTGIAWPETDGRTSSVRRRCTSRRCSPSIGSRAAPPPPTVKRGAPFSDEGSPRGGRGARGITGKT